MTQTSSSSQERLSTVRRYRRLFWGCFVVAVLGFLAGNSLGYPIVGIGVYWTSVLGMFVVWKGTSLQLFDEREQALDRRASHITLSLVGIALIIAAPGQEVFSKLGYEASPIVEGALWGYAAQFVVFGVVYLAIRFRQ